MIICKLGIESFTVCATAKFGKYAEYKMEVKVPAAVLFLNKKETTMKKGQTEMLATTVSPIDSTDKIIFTSSNQDIASVTDAGVVTVNHAGSAQITAQAESGASAECFVKVMQTLDSFKIIGLYDTKYTGEEITQNFKVTDGSNKRTISTIYGGGDCKMVVRQDLGSEHDERLLWNRLR